jgi:sensor domain CHASE-containing protein
MARRADERRDLNSFGAVLASSLEQQLERSLSSTFALASLIRHSSDGNIRDFDSIAAKIIEVYGGIDSLELAPGGVVLQSYPLGGNEQEIGDDLVNDPVWRANL